MPGCCLLHSGGAGESVDATGAVTSVQSVVALLSPAGTPAVLDQPVRHLLLKQREIILCNSLHYFPVRKLVLFHLQIRQ